MPCYSYETLFLSPSLEVKALQCCSPVDAVGFDDRYEASRISLVRTGVFARVIRGVSVLADSTQVLFVNEDDVHRFVHPLGGGDSCTVLEPSRATLREIQWRYDRSSPRFPVDQVCAPTIVHRRHDDFLRVIARRRTGSDLAVEELSLGLCADLTRLAQRHAPRRSVARGSVERRRRHIVEEARLVLNERFRSPPGLSALARIVRCSPFHLSRLFTTYAGMPMRAYVSRLRTAEAARRLLEGDTDFASLALELGYYDHSHFTNAFAAAWGVPPSRFLAGWRVASARAAVAQRFPNAGTRS